MSTLAFDHLANGSWMEAILTPYAEFIGLDWFVMIVVLIITMVIYSRTESLEVAGLTMAMLGFAGFSVRIFQALPKQAGILNFSMVGVYVLLMAMGIALIIFKLFKQGD